MRSARRITGWGAAAVAAALVVTATPAAALPVTDTTVPVAETPAPTAAPEQTATPEATAPAEPTASPTPEATEDAADERPARLSGERGDRARVAAAALVGDVAVTVFDDRYADGIFDTTKVARNGERDTPRDSARLFDVNGAWHEGNDDDKDGVILFEDVPAGRAEVHVTYPQGPGWNAFFDATGATSADDIERLIDGNYQGTPTAYAEVMVGEVTAAPVIGLTGLRAVADVKLPDGSAAVGANVEFGSHGQWFRGTDYGSINNAPNGTYEAFSTTGGPYQIHLPDELGVRLTVPGYRVAGVTAISGGGNTTDFIDVAERDGAYWIKATDAASYTFNPTFTVQLEALPTADLEVTEFDDRYADGIFDDTLGSGEKVDRQSRRLSHIVTSQGIRVNPGINDVGDYVFENVPLGPAKVYFTHPNSALESVFFDATGAEGADDIVAIDNEGTDSYAPAVASVDVEEGGSELLVGFTALHAVADVDYEDGTPASGVAVEFGSAGEWRPATEYPNEAYKGQYEVLNGSYGAPHLPDEIGVRLTPPAGWEIGDVAAISSSTNTTDFIDVTEGDVAGEYWIDTVDASTYFANPTFQITLVEAPTLEVTYFGDVALNGFYEDGIDTQVTASTVYLKDSAGDWFATTSGEDGRYSFSGIADGPATIYTQLPDTGDLPEIPELEGIELPEAALAVWDATGVTSPRETIEAPTETISFTGGTAIDPATGARTPIDVQGELVAAVSTEIDDAEPAEPSRVDIGAATVFQVAAVVDAAGQPVAADVQIEFFGNNAGTGLVDELVDGAGAYIAEESGEVAVFGAAEYGINPVVPAGYKVVSVAAVSGAGEVLEVQSPSLAATGRLALAAAAPAYRVAPEQVGGPLGAVIWAVQVAPAALVPPTTPGTDPGLGLPSTAPQPAAGPATLPATGSDVNTFALVFAAGALIIAGLGARVVVRRRNS